MADSWWRLNFISEGYRLFAPFGSKTRVLTGLENLEKSEGIFESGKSQRILNRLKKAGKSHKILEKSGNFRYILFIILVVFKLAMC